MIKYCSQYMNIYFNILASGKYMKVKVHILCSVKASI